MIGFAAQRLMELEVETLTGAPHGIRAPDRFTHRNGYCERDWEARAGTVELRIPRLRKGSYFLGACRTGEVYETMIPNSLRIRAFLLSVARPEKQIAISFSFWP
jgi:hypothetical protein